MARVFKGLALAAARAVSDKKGENITLLNVRRHCSVTDYMLIATALSKTHLEALEAEVEKAAKDLRFPCLRRSRPQSDRWRVLDFGGILVHLMTQETREFYNLEKLYHASPRLRWEEHRANGSPRPRSRRPARHA